MISSHTAGLGLVALLLFVGHWYRWPTGKLTDTDKGRLFAYAYGVGSILAGQAVWLLTTPMVQRYGWYLFLEVAAFAVVGGLATGLAYLVDAIQGWWLKATRGITDDGQADE